MKLTSKQALTMLENARGKTPSDGWIDHSICVGSTAGKIAESLNLADHIYLTEIFGSAREASGTVDIQTLIDKCHSGHLITKETVNQLHNYPTAVIVFMGAGDIKKYEDEVIARIGDLILRNNAKEYIKI